MPTCMAQSLSCMLFLTVFIPLPHYLPCYSMHTILQDKDSLVAPYAGSSL